MKTLPTIEGVLAQPATVDDLIAGLRQLAEERRVHGDEWENASLEAYLLALAAWLESFRAKVGDKPDWRAFLTALEAARFYE